MSEAQGPRKIYVIECGEYSDYHVICAFESEEDATREFAGYDVMEMALYPSGVKPVETHLGWTVTARVYSDGRTDEYLPPNRSEHHDWEVSPAPAPMPARPNVDVKDLRFTSMWDCWLITATGWDLDTVKKAVSDRVAHLRAEAMGL